jgi:hypothetical protein
MTGPVWSGLPYVLGAAEFRAARSSRKSFTGDHDDHDVAPTTSSSAAVCRAIEAVSSSQQSVA